MLQMYAQERKKIIDDFTQRKSFYLGELQNHVRRPYKLDFDGNPIPRPQPDPIQDRANWNGEKCWFEHLESALKTLEEKYKPYLNFKSPKKYMWVGINPPPDYTMKSLYDKLEELKLDRYIAVVEGHTENGYRPHIHMIYTGHHKPYRIIDKLSKHFNCEPNFIEAQNCKFYYEEKIDYINGKKTQSKLPLVEADKAERNQYNIPHIVEK